MAGFVWYCDQHRVHGNAPTVNEAHHMASAHLSYYAESVFDDAHPTFKEHCTDHVGSLVILTAQDWWTNGVYRWIEGTLPTLGAHNADD